MSCDAPLKLAGDECDRQGQKRKRRADRNSYGPSLKTSPLTQQQTSGTPVNLCARCAAVDLENIFDIRINRSLGEFVMDLEESTDGMKHSNCGLCALLATMAPVKFDDSNSSTDGKLHVRAFSMNRAFAGPQWKGFLEGDSTLIGVVKITHAMAKSGKDGALSKVTKSLDETGYIGILQESRTTTPFAIRRLNNAEFDETFARDSLGYCTSNHGRACEGLDGPRYSLSTFDFRLIDCENRRIVNATPGCRYVALSYLWGLTASDAPLFQHSRDQPVLPDDCPEVINDSIKVALKLGCKYVWVDRYCINQLDPNDIEAQISVMDLIYARAHFTIIVAAGDGPNYGLPGVNHKNRKQQPILHIGNRTLVSSLPKPTWSISSSKWNTRGWTFQEGFLSKRRLIFTDDQVLFECNTMDCAEVLWKPLDALHCKAQKGNGERELRGTIPAASFSHHTPGNFPIDVISHLSNFTQRKLTYPTDALNAFQGIFHVFASSEFPVQELEGVPLLPSTHLKNSKRQFPFDRTPSDSLVLGLSWSHKNPGKRRPQFPSWSWAGWEGQLEPSLFWAKFWEEETFHTNVEHIEDSDGTLWELPLTHADLPHMLRDLKLSLPSILYVHIKAATFPCNLVYIDRHKHLTVDERELKQGPQHNGYYIKLQLGEASSPSINGGDTCVYAPAYLDRPARGLLRSSLLCITFHGNHQVELSLVEEQSLLLVRESKGCYERVGWSPFHEGHVKTGPEGRWAGKAKWHYDAPSIRLMKTQTIRLG